MISSLAFSPAYFLLLGAMCGVVGFRIGWRARSRFILPFVQGLLGWVAFTYAWRGHGPAVAAATVGCWALATSVVTLYFFIGHPQATDQRVLHAASYRTAMLEPLRTSSSARSRPVAALLSRLHHVVVHLALAMLTANLASMIVGAARLNVMNTWVATLLRAARRKGIVALLGWPVWIVLRVAAFAAIGTAAAAPFAARLGYPAPQGSIRPLVVAGAVGFAIDVALELLASRRWEARLAGAVDLEAATGNRRFEPPFHLGLEQASSGRGEDPQIR